jgi:hypothetical protein
MRVRAGENYVELVPETTWEIDQLKRLDLPGANFTTQLVEAPGDSYPPSMKQGASLKVMIPQHPWNR